MTGRLTILRTESRALFRADGRPVLGTMSRPVCCSAPRTQSGSGRCPLGRRVDGSEKGTLDRAVERPEFGVPWDPSNGTIRRIWVRHAARRLVWPGCRFVEPARGPMAPYRLGMKTLHVTMEAALPVPSGPAASEAAGEPSTPEALNEHALRDRDERLLALLAPDLAPLMDSTELGEPLAARDGQPAAVALHALLDARIAACSLARLAYGTNGRVYVARRRMDREHANMQRGLLALISGVTPFLVLWSGLPYPVWWMFAAWGIWWACARWVRSLEAWYLAEPVEPGTLLMERALGNFQFILSRRATDMAAHRHPRSD